MGQAPDLHCHVLGHWWGQAKGSYRTTGEDKQSVAMRPGGIHLPRFGDRGKIVARHLVLRVGVPTRSQPTMDVSTLLLGAGLLALPLIGAGLLGAIIVLERQKPLAPAAATSAANGSARRRPRRSNARRRR